jgi:predicted DNA-binding protein (UPF0251 family)
MIDIYRLDILLCAWGRWANASITRSLGYPRVSPMFRDARPGRAYTSTPPAGLTSPDSQWIDDAINQLPSIPRIILMDYYQIGGTMRQCAARTGIHHTAFGRGLENAKKMLTEILNTLDTPPKQHQNTHISANLV